MRLHLVKEIARVCEGPNVLGHSANDGHSDNLVLINPIINVAGGSNIELMNPNGWYCLRTTVSIIGGVSIRAHCKAQLAATSDGAAIRGSDGENRAIKNLNVTVIGSVSIERPCS